MKHRASWTEQDFSRLKAMRADGATLRQCADALGRTQLACQQKLLYVRRISKPRPWNDETARRLATLAAEGKSASEIGALLGFTKNAVIGRAHRQGTMLKGQRRFTPDAGWRARRNQYQRQWRLTNPESVARTRRKIKAKKHRKRFGPKPKDWKPLPAALPDYPSALNLPLISVGRNQCRFMPGELLLCCGHKTHNDTAYCEHHWELCHA